MSFEQFMYYLDAYGAAFERWPVELRETARAFAAASPAAAAAQAETLRLDRVLDRLAPVPDPAAVRRVVARARAHGAIPRRVETAGIFAQALSGRALSRAAIFAAVALLGVATGVFQLAAPVADPTLFNLAQVQLDDPPFEVAGL